LVGSYHAGTQLVEEAKSRFVARQAKLSLELDSGHARRLAGEEVGGPKPSAKRHMASLHHRAHGQPRIPAAGPATQDTGASREPEWFSDHAAVRAGEASIPACFLQIDGARLVIWEKLLKLRKRFREWQIIASKNVHGVHFIIRFSPTTYPLAQ
jgi:hypothetical protein